MQTLSRKEAADALGISLRTLDRYKSKGKVRFQKLGEGQYAETRFTYTDLGLPEPPEPTLAVIPPAPEPEPEQPACPTPEPSAIELRQQADAAFAASFKSGEGTDSMGNRITGTNDRFPSKGLQSMLGPVQPREKRRPDTTIHMDRALVGNVEAKPNAVDSDEYQELLHPGYKARKDAMYANAGVRQPSEQEKKHSVDQRAIALAFRHGYSR